MSMLLLMGDPTPTELIRAMYAQGEQGIWLDPPDFSTLFQDAAGATPVTATGQQDGLALDKRLGMALGAEQFPTFDFTNWGNAGAVTGKTANGFTTSGVGGVTKALPPPNVVNRTFRITVTGTSTVSFYIRNTANLNGSILVGAGAFSVTFTSPLLNIAVNNLYFAVTGAGTVEFTSLSIRELPGNHAYQTTLAARPTAQSNYLSLDKTDDHLLVAAGGAGTTGFLLVAGIMVPAAGTARTLWSDRDTNTGYKVGIDASNQIFLSAGNGAAFVTATGPALVAGTKYVITAWHDGANLNVSVNNGAPTQAAFVTATAGTATFTIGKANASATEYWGDRIYGMVYRKNDTSAASQRSSLYSYMVGKMGGL